MSDIEVIAPLMLVRLDPQKKRKIKYKNRNGADADSRH